jgi:hypothetical protein
MTTELKNYYNKIYALYLKFMDKNFNFFPKKVNMLKEVQP